MIGKNQLPNQIKVIQSLRGVASVGVMFVHLWHQPKSIIILPSIKAICKAGAYGVHAFFIISGFILLYSLNKHDYKLKSYFRFILRRLIRLEPVYIISILTVLFFAYVLAPSLNVPFESRHRSTFDLLLHLFYLVPFYKGSNWVQGVNWTLAIEFQFYLLVGLLASIFVRFDVKKYLLHALLIAISLASLLYRDGAFLITWLTFFGIGMTTFLLVVKRFNYLDFIVQFCIAATINYFIFKSPYLVLVLFLTPAIIYFFLEYKRMPFQFLGKISYSLYLVHGTIGIFTIQFCETRLNMNMLYNQVFALTLSVFLSILLAWGFYVLFEKPFSNLSKKVTI